MSDTVSINAIYCNDISGDELTPSCRFNVPVAQDGTRCDELLYHAAAGNGTGKLQELIELDRVGMNLNFCQCVLTGVTT